MIICFVTPLQVEELTDNKWKLTSSFLVTVDDKKFTVPVDFITDFASVPRLPFVYLMFGGIGNRPAVLHDFLYSLGGTIADKEFADLCLYHGIIADGDSKFKAWAMYKAVKTFGMSHWIDKSLPVEIK